MELKCKVFKLKETLPFYKMENQSPVTDCLSQSKLFLTSWEVNRASVTLSFSTIIKVKGKKDPSIYPSLLAIRIQIRSFDFKSSKPF